VIEQPPLPITSGSLVCPIKPGLGITVDERLLDKYTSNRIPAGPCVSSFPISAGRVSTAFCWRAPPP